MNRPVFLATENQDCIVGVLQAKNGQTLTCEGEVMQEMTANTSEGAAEKHLPVIEQNENEVIVKVGTIFHPMTEEHSIGWVYLETEKGGQRFILNPDEPPIAKFAIAKGDKPVAAYAYCNLHGFWKTEIE